MKDWTQNELSRRNLFKVGGAVVGSAALGSLLSACGLSKPGADSAATPTSAGGAPAVTGTKPVELVVGTNGGSWYENVYKAAFAPFEKKHNVKIVPVYGAGSELLTKAMAEKANPSMDMIVTYQGAWQTGKAEGLFEKLDYGNIPNIDDAYPFLKDRDSYGPYVNMAAWGIVYNADVVKNPPKSFKDLWKSEYGKQVMIGGVYHYQIHLAAFAHAWGGDQHKVDDVGFAKVKELAPMLAAFYGLTSDAQGKFQQKVGSMATWYSNAAQRLRQQGVPLNFVTPEEGAFLYPMSWQALKGTKKKDLVEKLIGQFYEPATVKMLAELEGYVPANRNVKLDDKLQKELLTYDEVTRANQWDWQYVNDNDAKWQDRWNKEIKPLLK